MADEQDDRLQAPRDRMVELGGDRTRLLRGEDPATEYPDDARHWIAVYNELLGFKQDVLRTIEGRVPTISEDARDEVVGTDLPLMRAEASRFVDRIEFWERRLAELEGSGSSGHG